MVTYASGGGGVLDSRARIFGAKPDVFPEGVENLECSRHSELRPISLSV